MVAGMNGRTSPTPARTMPLVERINARGLHEHLAEVVLALRVPPAAPVLDLGCGSGAWLERLCGLGYSNVLGVDSDTVQFGAEGVECVSCDLESALPSLGCSSFRLITAIEVIEHVANTGQFVRSLGALLADDGLGLITTPNMHSLAARLRYCLTGRLPEFDDRGEPTHITPIFLEPLRRLLDREGLVIDRVWTFPEREAGAVWRRTLRLLVGLMRLAFRDPLPGISLCVLVRRQR